MIPPVFKERRNYLIAGLVVFFALFALWLRLLPGLSTGTTDIMSLVAMDDPFYNLRQVELILAHFPGYDWFDPMSCYPHGTVVYWGPLFPTIIATGCLITGAATRPEIIGTALLATPLFAAAIVVLMYYVGRFFGDWKTGLLASGFTAAVSGQFYTVSLYGYIDHHIAEVLFSTLFCLLYGYALVTARDAAIDLNQIAVQKKVLFLSFVAGIGYLLGLFVMPTMILFALIAGVYTVVQFVTDAYRGHRTEYLLVVNGIVFVTASVGLLIFGIKDPALNLSTYSIGHIYAYLGLVAGTILLYLFSRYLAGKNRWYFPAALAGCAVAGAAVLLVAVPQIYGLLIASLFNFFGQAPVTQTVLEARGWSLENAWSSFNYGLILFAGGFLVLAWKNFRNIRPHQVFLLAWSAVIFFATWQHVRYEYYLAINIALLSAVLVGFAAEEAWPAVRRAIGAARNSRDAGPNDGSIPLEGRKKTPKKAKKAAAGTAASDYPVLGFFAVAVLIAVLFTGTSVYDIYSSASLGGIRLDPDWEESLAWMGNNTPDPGVQYLGVYDQTTFAYPAQSYGVMSWWDYGHMITYIAKRIPNANPFQAGVSGPDGAAAFFVTTSEETADTIRDHDGIRYVVTDILMDTGKFPAMATWYNQTLAEMPYMPTMYVPDPSTAGRYEPAMLYTGDYYLTMVSRLQNFDGSMTNASGCIYIEYADGKTANASLPVITGAVPMDNSTAAGERAQEYNRNAPAGHHAGVIGVSIAKPAVTVPALRHYRLVHESPTNVFGSGTPDIKYVKVFEYVSGAHIRGTGVIELPLVANTGRNFTYRQESINGEFVVPYATGGSTGGVTATGNYRIQGTGKEYAVPEEAVVQGLTVP
ncbi:oligosaccharyl transferase, archaeosortase A system-associated [Methanoregula sp. UBA64]|uniref:oligosaccharyl transferase, archaeosortase A system-associated n=1 Tax=Methanoregula sp. UBA64 TaxID=1915554 RepID=UPI0025F528FD|nr:oligosaccharyl transferase, archaeosortase A system-associated [Methanoregula sp. UBA64]